VLKRDQSDGFESTNGVEPEAVPVPPNRRTIIMSRLIAIGACGLLLASCTSSMLPSGSVLGSSETPVALRLESDPPGAEARVGEQACQTPCELSVAPAADMTATFTLKGYQSQTIGLEVVPGGSPLRGEPLNARILPNPVLAELEPEPARPARKAAPRRAPAKSAPAQKSTPAPSSAPAAESPATGPAPANPFPDPPATAFPPPASNQSSPFPPPPASAFPPPPAR